MTTPRKDYIDTPVYWFVVLETARTKGNFLMANHAQTELRRLGVRVTFERPKCQHEDRAHA